MLKEFKAEYFIILVIVFVFLSTGELEGRPVQDLIPAALILVVLIGMILSVVNQK